MRRHLSFANVVSLLALFVALGGTAVAAVLVTSTQIKDGTIVARDVKPRSLTADRFRAGQLPAGPRGVAGPVGAAGPAGAAGAAGTAGAAGPAGTVGPQGARGANGADGANGANGADGVDGARGQAGATGTTGARGTTGVRGATGPEGTTGARGPSAFEPIPSGTTVGGLIFEQDVSPTVNGSFGTSVALPGVAPEGIFGTEDVVFRPGNALTSAAEEDAACTGTANVPTAPAGKVCVYILSDTNGVAADSAFGIGLAPSFAATATRAFVVGWRSAAADSVRFAAAWAYTAP